MQDQAVDYSRKWLVMIAVGTGVILTTIDGTIVNVALPTLVRELNTDFATVQWVVLGYLLSLATLLLSIGRLGDMIGKKPIYNGGFVIFTIGSVLCGLAPTISWLIGFRIVQAIGGAMMLALGLAIVTEAFPPQERGKAMGIISGIISVGIVLGPTLGGLIIEASSWNWIFFVNLPVGIVGTLLVQRLVPSFKPTGRQKFDYLGAITLFISLLSLLLALTFGQQIGFGERRILFLFASWTVFLVAFIIIEWYSEQPMIDPRLFRNRLFSINLVTGLITFIAIAGTVILMPFYLEDVLGYDTRQVGLLMAATPIVLGIVAPLSGTLSDRFGTRSITALGLLVLLIGYYAMSTLDDQTTAVGFILRLLPVGIGMGVFQSPNNSAIMGSVPRERLGIASGLLSITRTLGQTIGIAILGALWASRVMFHAGRALPGGATTAAAEAQIAGLQETFLVTLMLMAFGLALSLWGLVQERRLQRTAASTLVP
jgi:EmrB/QacA subfamily drug resistance transporter